MSFVKSENIWICVQEEHIKIHPYVLISYMFI